MLKLYDLTIEYKHEPLGLDEVQPRFSWKPESDKQDTVQAAYRLALNCGGKTVWDSDRVESEQSILNEYRKLYSLVLSCTHRRKTTEEKIQRFAVLRIGYDSILVFYLFSYLFVLGLPVQGNPV